ncbi:MAG: dihydroorotate dehydrogenase-like protein [Sandaracinus sp.]
MTDTTPPTSHSLETDYLGLRLSSPIVPGASPLADHLDTVLRLEDAGAPAIGMRSLFEEQLTLEEHAVRTHVTHAGVGGESTRAFLPESAFAMGLDRYLEQIDRIRRRVAIPVIGSLNGATPGGWVDHARMVEQAGASALELNLYTLPSDPDRSAAEVEHEQLEVVRRVVARVTIPVAVKLGPFYSSLPSFVRACGDAGARGVVLFNRFYQADIDPIALTTRRTLHLSTSSELTLRLRWLALISPRTKLSLAASGGVHEPLDAIKALMAGATVVQVVSSLLVHGPERLRTLTEGLRTFLAHEEYRSLDQLRGNMSAARSPDPSAFERADYVQVLSSWHGSTPSHRPASGRP